MWMFGKVSQAEYDRIEKQGWQIERMPSAAEIHQFCDPASWKTTDEPECGEDDFFVLVYVDDDLGKTLTAWHEEAEFHRAGRAAAEAKEELENRRRQFADDALGTFDFHNCEQNICEDEEINDTGNWESDGPDRLICPVYYGDKSKENPEDEGSYTGAFIVEFKPGTAEIIDRHESMR